MFPSSQNIQNNQPSTTVYHNLHLHINPSDILIHEKVQIAADLDLVKIIA